MPTLSKFLQSAPILSNESPSPSMEGGEKPVGPPNPSILGPFRGRMGMEGLVSW